MSASEQLKSTLKTLLPTFIVEKVTNFKQALFTKPLHFYKDYEPYIVGKKGLEIGGPSPLFRYFFPLYGEVSSLDGVNFSGITQWEGQITEGKTYNYFGKQLGHQYISDGINLSQIDEASYDFLVTSNCLEHIANPIRALVEWRRVIKEGGALILILPNKAINFDHKRPITAFEHLVDDYNNNTTEHDLTHLEEILALHDLSMDPLAGDLDNFKRRSLDNYNNRCLHHHVFDLDVMQKMVEFSGFECILKDENEVDYFLLAVKN